MSIDIERAKRINQIPLGEYDIEVRAAFLENQEEIGKLAQQINALVSEFAEINPGSKPMLMHLAFGTVMAAQLEFLDREHFSCFLDICKHAIDIRIAEIEKRKIQ